MRNHASNNNSEFMNIINDMTLKHYHNHDNLVVDVTKSDKTTWENLLLGLEDIREAAEDVYGTFENIDIRVH